MSNDIKPLPAEEQRPLTCEYCNQPVEEGIPCKCGDQEASVDAAFIKTASGYDPTEPRNAVDEDDWDSFRRANGFAED